MILLDHRTTGAQEKIESDGKDHPRAEAGAVTIDQAFEAWWAKLPPAMKQKKKRGKRYWLALWKAEKDRWDGEIRKMEADLSEKIQAQVAAQHFRGRDGQDYYPYGPTWLADGRYDDEITVRGDQGGPGRPPAAPEDNRLLTDQERARILRPREPRA